MTRSYDHYRLTEVRDGKEWTWFVDCLSSITTSAAIARLQAKWPNAKVEPLSNVEG